MPQNHRRRRSRIALPEITLTPLIDTVLVLLIIFMMAMPVLQTYIPVDLPQADQNTTSAQTSEPVSVHVDRNQQHYVNGAQVARNEISQKVTQALQNTEDKGIIVYGDAQITYGTIVALLDDVKAIHAAEYVALAAEPRRE